MARESASQTLRNLGTLFALGTIGGLTDAQLLERFLDRDGVDREDAFAVLVQRHGPMVLGVCRRRLSGSADAEDAFQAVFLVLARKAATVRSGEGLKAWLYAVAVRTTKEAQRRSARQRAREEAMRDRLKETSAPEKERTELLDLFDEEFDRLPSRFRDPLLLCELEGTSRQEAARRLGLPEGTLSSRLARGRSMLRDRLTRRGVAFGAGLSTLLKTEAANAALPEPLADNTVRLAVLFAAGGGESGTIPAAITVLAEGVLAMFSVAKLKLLIVAAVALGVTVCTMGGLARALGPRDHAAPPLAKTPVGSDQDKKPATDPKATDRRHAEVRGVVIDEAGQPVAEVEVLADAFTGFETRGLTGPDGSFTLSRRRDRLDGTSLLARSTDGGRLGFFRYEYNLTPAAAKAPARIVLKPAREVVIRVNDAAKAPVTGAGVEAAGNFAVLDNVRTGPDGSARLRIPTDAKVEWIVARRSGLGFDYAEFGAPDERGRPRGGASAAELPNSVALTLDGARTARIKATDSSGKPVAGAGLYPWLLFREGRQSQVNYSSRLLTATTGPDGIALFDWLPKGNQTLQFWAVDEDYARRRVTVENERAEPVVARLLRTETIQGRVVRPDGSPASGIELHAYGSGHGLDQGQADTRTAADGSYELRVNPNEAYAVYVDDKEWAAPSRLDVIVREGKSVKGVNFRLSRGTIIRGTVTIGPGKRPAIGQYIRLDETGGMAPEEFREPGDRFAHEVRRQFGASTDSAGRYSIRVGPGTYTLMGPPRTENVKLTVGNESEVVHDFRMPRPEKGPITGRVVRSGARENGIAGARIEIAAANLRAYPYTVTADDEGRFHADRDLDRLTIFAKSPDGTLGGMVEVGAEETETIIPVAPMATATGRLLNEDGKIASNQKLEWGRRISLDDERQVSMHCFAPKVVTDSEGRFTLPSLVVGQTYEIFLSKEHRYLPAGVVQPEKSGPIDLGTLRAGSYRPKSLASAEEMSSFRTDAPGSGAIAPAIEGTTLDGRPLKLADFHGRYVLLDFWATWCGPCIAELPQLQAVHDTFGNDKRFAILSVSVDEKIDEPRKFQETRKLPWTQAFLGGGIHGPTPGKFGIRAIPAFVLVGPDGRIVARGMRGEEIKKAVAKALAK
jgi:RNA polymerase sigma factor (sigma-70 family)